VDDDDNNNNNNNNNKVLLLYVSSLLIRLTIPLFYMPIIVQQDATIYSLFIFVNRSTCFVWYLHPSSGAHVTVSTASGISTTVTERDRTGTSSRPVTFTTGDAVDTVT